MSIFRVAFAPALGGGKHDAWADGNVINDKFREIGAQPGTIFPFEGNLYQIVRNRAGGALAAGDLVKPYFAAAGRLGNLTADSTKAVVVTDDTFVKNDLVGGRDYPGYLFITVGTAVGVRRRILANSDDAGASTITVAKYDRAANVAAISSVDAFDALPDATSDYSVYCPWEVTKSAALYDKCMGVALCAVTDAYWTIIQITGVCLMKIDGTTVDMAAGDVVAASGAAGVAEVFGVPGDATVARNQATSGVGIGLSAYTANAVALREVLLGGPGLINPYRFVTN